MDPNPSDENYEGIWWERADWKHRVWTLAVVGGLLVVATAVAALFVSIAGQMP